MDWSVIRSVFSPFSVLLRSRRGRFAARAAIGALATLVLTAPTAMAGPSAAADAAAAAAAKPRVIATIRLTQVPASVAVSPQSGDVYAGNSGGSVNGIDVLVISG
jgi:DNA-binding beta-propeller fold protein YncE